MKFDRDRRRRVIDYAMGVAALGCVVLALVPLGGVLFEATVRGLPAISGTFFTANQPAPCDRAVTSDCQAGGIGNAIQGTLILITIAAAIALPLGIAGGIYLSEYGHNRLGVTVRFAMDVMSGIPSIVIGIFVYTLVLTLNRQFVFSAVSGGVALAVIMLPVVARTSEEALRLVPVTTREAALALGIPKFKVTLRVVLASARGGLVTGGLLAVARAAGETAPLIMTAFGNPFGFQGFDHPIASLTFVIFYYGTSAYENWQGLAWGATLILILIMLAISIAARIALRSRFGSRENA